MRHERQVTVPAGHLFVVAVSGVIAEKTGAAREAYNRASLAVRAILDAWRAASGREDASLAAAVANGAARDAGELVKRATVGGFTTDLLQARFEQFVEESNALVPGGGDALQAGDLARFGALADRSQSFAERLLRNQVPETIALAHSARELGAVAASAFGAGFGGSVWALVGTASPPSSAGAGEAATPRRFRRRLRARPFSRRGPGPAAMAI